jgi:hypothetical protein
METMVINMQHLVFPNQPVSGKPNVTPLHDPKKIKTDTKCEISGLPN